MQKLFSLLASIVITTALLPVKGTEALVASPYKLPVSPHQSIYVNQGNKGAFSHGSRSYSAYAFDFVAENDKGANTSFTIAASRGGTVLSTRSDSSTQCSGLNVKSDGTELKNCWAEANYILIDHKDGTSGLYLHLKKDSIHVEAGDQVQQGQEIATSGTTGYSTGIHLHFQTESTPCSQKDEKESGQCKKTAGWWFTQSTEISFSDKDVLKKNSTGIPSSDSKDNPYTSDNVQPTPTPPHSPVPVLVPTPRAPTFTVAGHVTDSNGPLANVAVLALDESGKTKYSVKTNKNGEYALAVLAGRYTIAVKQNGYTFSPAPVLVKISANTAGPNFSGVLITSPTVTPPVPQPRPTPVQPASSSPGPVMAFYYPWYEPDDWNSGKMSDTANPTYSGGDDDVMRRHIQQADEVGIDALICAWFGPNEDRINKRCHRLLQLVQESGRHIRVAIFPDPASFTDLYKPGNMSEALDVIRKEFTSSPAYFTWQGKPVVFFYHPQSLGTVQDWIQLRDQKDANRDQIWLGGTDDFSYLNVYDGLFYFDISWEKSEGAAMASYSNRLKAYNKTHNAAKPFIATTQPGYDDTLYRGQGHVVRDRANGDYYRSTWKAATAHRAAMVLITSFNEFYEGSYIEPSAKFGDQYLQITKELIGQYHK